MLKPSTGTVPGGNKLYSIMNKYVYVSMYVDVRIFDLPFIPNIIYTSILFTHLPVTCNTTSILSILYLERVLLNIVKIRKIESN